jgi:hypothetical protein
MKWWQLNKRDADLERELRSDLELEEEEQRENGVSPDGRLHFRPLSSWPASFLPSAPPKSIPWPSSEANGESISMSGIYRVAADST